MKILVIEDDQTLNNFIAKGLREAGFLAEQCSDGKEALFLLASESYELIILDRMLPNVDGMTILRTIRASGTLTPVLILSALDEVDQRVEGLSGGADDYLTKPFSFKELLARVQVLLRRHDKGTEVSGQLQVADLRLDISRQKVWLGDEVLNMQPREFRLLEFLMRHEGQLVSRTMLLESVWEYHFDPQTNIVDVHISRLRNKIDKNRTKSLIKTVRGAGYVLEANS